MPREWALGGAGGVEMCTVSTINYSDTSQVSEFWHALKVFTAQTKWKTDESDDIETSFKHYDSLDP
jgi:hypothetical protein